MVNERCRDELGRKRYASVSKRLEHHPGHSEV